MHDLDRTVLELNDEAADELEGAADEFEAGSDEFEAPLTDEDAPLSESDELELASEMLGLHDPGELEYFLGSFVNRVVKTAKGFAQSPIGKMLVSQLGGLAKKALPAIATGLGATVGGPLGAQIAGQLASQAGQMFGLELEGLSGEDQEFEAARRFVRFAGAAARDAAQAPQHLPPRDAARAALVRAARTHAPGLLVSSGAAGVPYGRSHHARSGRWVMKRLPDGRRAIVIYGV